MQSSFTTTTTLATTNAYDEGAIGYDSKDVEIPLLSLVQGVGDLNGKELANGDMAKAGDLVLMREFKLSAPINVTIVRHQKYFEQNISWDSEKRRKMFYTEEEVLKSGGNLDYGKKQDDDPDNYIRGSKISLAIEVPEDFPVAIEFNEKHYCPAQWKVSKSAFQAVIPRLNLIQQVLNVRKEPIASKIFTLSSARVEKGGHRFYSPVLKDVGVNTPEFVEFVRGFFV